MADYNRHYGAQQPLREMWSAMVNPGEAEVMAHREFAEEMAGVLGVRNKRSSIFAVPAARELRGVFGVWWLHGYRVERNFLGEYVVQDGTNFGSLSEALAHVDRMNFACTVDKERFGVCWPMRDVYGWPGVPVAEPADAWLLDEWELRVPGMVVAAFCFILGLSVALFL